jgi:hypothetical protein
VREPTLAATSGSTAASNWHKRCSRPELVDELQLVVGPAIGLPGRRLFTYTKDVRRLELLSALPTPSGSVALAYRLPEASAYPSTPIT